MKPPKKFFHKCGTRLAMQDCPYCHRPNCKRLICGKCNERVRAYLHSCEVKEYIEAFKDWKCRHKHLGGIYFQSTGAYQIYCVECDKVMMRKTKRVRKLLRELKRQNDI